MSDNKGDDGYNDCLVCGEEIKIGDEVRFGKRKESGLFPTRHVGCKPEKRNNE